jgi:anti-sigma-K factor RskA
MMDTDHDELRDNAGPWVLGALDDDEAWRFSAHLEVCSSCREEVERLRVAAAALPLAATPVEPPPALKARLMNIVQAEAQERRAATEGRGGSVSRWRTWLGALQARPALAAGLAALLIVAGGVAGFAARGGDEGTHTQTSVAKVDLPAAPGASAQLVQGDGAQLRVSNMPEPSPGHVYQVWVQRDGGKPQPDAVFTVDRSGRGSVGVRGDLDGARQVLVTQEPDGGSRVPSSAVVLSVRPA